MNAVHQGSSVGSRGQDGRLAAERLETFERARIADRVPAEGNRDVVAAVLAFDAEAVGQPPHGRVEEEDGLDGRLDQVDRVVVPAHVRQLVGQDGAQLLGAETRDGGDGNEHDGTQVPHDRRDARQGRDHHADGGAQPELRAHASHNALPAFGQRLRRLAAQAPCGTPLPERAQLHQDAAQDPADPEHREQQAPNRRGRGAGQRVDQREGLLRPCDRRRCDA